MCICRNIRESDFETEQDLRERIMRPDFHCGQCQIRFMKTVDTTTQEAVQYPHQHPVSLWEHMLK